MRYFGDADAQELEEKTGGLLIDPDSVDPETGFVMGTECKPWQFICRAQAKSAAIKEAEAAARDFTWDLDYAEGGIRPIHWIAMGGVIALFFGVNYFLDKRKE